MFLKQRIRKGERVIGSWLQTSDSRIAGLMASCGLDWLAVDMEHGSISVDQLPAICDAVQVHGTVPLVRVTDSGEMAIRRSIEAGAEGVIVPMIRSKEEARQVVDAACYPPVGKRGVGFCNGSLYGKDFDNYFKTWNDRCVIITQIESVEGVDAADEILSVPEVDGYMVGPYDLSGSLNVLGQFDSPVFEEATARVRLAAEKAGKAAGTHVVMPGLEGLQKAIADGYSFIAYSIDTVVIWKHFSEVLGTIGK